MVALTSCTTKCCCTLQSQSGVFSSVLSRLVAQSWYTPRCSCSLVPCHNYTDLFLFHILHTSLDLVQFYPVINSCCFSFVFIGILDWVRHKVQLYPVINRCISICNMSISSLDVHCSRAIGFERKRILRTIVSLCGIDAVCYTSW